MNKIAKICAISGLVLAVGGGTAYGIAYGTKTENTSNTASADSAENTTVQADVEKIIAQAEKDQTEISLSDKSGTVSITKGGSYSLSGTLSEGQVYVNTSDTVVLILDDANITNSSDAAIFIENGDVYIELKEGTANRLQSGTETEIVTAAEDTENTVSGAALRAKDDLYITGTGKLEVLGYINNGIQSSNNLIIESGKIEVTALNNGIKGKDSVSITDGSISVRSGGDGIESDTDIAIGGGDISIISGGGSENASIVFGNGDFGGFGGRGNFGGFGADGEPPEMPENGDRENFGGRGGKGGFRDFGDNGDTPSEMPGNLRSMPDSNDRGVKGNFDGFRGESFDMDDESAVSTKGIKCGGSIKISGGTISIDSYDDAIHSNDSITITGGTFELSSGDDGIHADKTLTVEDGTITVSRSYEGLEGNQIHLNGGTIDITADDDGVNAYGGQNNFGGWGESAKTTEETPMLYFSGADVTVNSGGDGIDSNGSLFVEAGTVIVNGPVNSMNGAIDSGSENGGKCIITGGTILAIGAAGMDEGFSAESSQCSFRIRPSAAISAGSEIKITDAEGNVLFSHTAVKSASSVVFSSPELKQGEKYILSVDGEETEIEQSSVSVSNGGNSGFGFGGFENGGGRGRRW
ncbi:MAG: carbohydrate-binding domain-containing protein [Oscillospiraceae bacterium]|nr:carbohydrate-binding domain-containing protein [Oscillospiraceae bacterium]